MHRFIIACVFLSHLLFKPLGLVDWVIEFAKAVGNLTPADK